MKNPSTKIPLLFPVIIAVIGGALVFAAWQGALLDKNGKVSNAPAATAAPGIPNGALVRANNAPTVYYIENGWKRAIDSEQAFNSQGFQWGNITTVDPDQLSLYQTGLPITSTTFLALPNTKYLMPDLAPVAPYDIRFAREEGRTRLRFTATFWNRGAGAMELRSNVSENLDQDATYEAFQRIYQPGGTFLERSVGTMYWHAVHDHYHYVEFGEYTLRLLRANDGKTQDAILNQKTTFCMRDDQAIGAAADGPKQPRKYTGCHGNFQGVSVGWADVYPHTLPDQYFDVTDLPAGLYEISFRVDQQERFTESRRDNNKSVALIEIDPARRALKVIATASPYEAGTNKYQDGLLIQAEGDGKIYVMRGNKKRWIMSEDVFKSYGYSFADVRVLPKVNVDVIPEDILVRLKGTGTVYAVNDFGFKRRILSPDILKSYKLSGTDIADVNQVEFDSYPETDLVKLEGTTRVYSINKREYVGEFDSLPFGINQNSVHTVNQTDFQTYAVQVVATGLVIPWDIAFLPDGDMLVTERTGTVRRIGKQTASMAIPNVHTAGEGGLMGIALDPAFVQNNFVYLYFTTNEGGRKNRVVRYKLDNNKLVQDRIILDNIPSATYHDGGQITFGPDGKLWVVTGDAQDPDLAQDKNSLAGKILRMNSDGSTPSDNPFGNLVWSYGHRNPQGLAWDNSGRLYAAEHGPTGEFGLCCRDELNHIEKGKNYGWPIITGDQTRDGMVTPLLHSGANDTWAPSSLVYMDGSLFMAGLRGSSMFQVTLDSSGKAKDIRSFFKDLYGRLRGAVIGPDGFLYITTSNRDNRGTPRAGDDKIIRVHPDFF